jgi:glycosyltransferase involved in cell wall biosynthesis
MTREKPNVSIIIPCHNESGTIEETIEKLNRALMKSGNQYEIIIVNDASTDNTLDILDKSKTRKTRIVTNHYQLGYGASIKIGIKHSRFRWIGICDADGTYPLDRFDDLLKQAGEYDMVVGERTGKVRAIPLLRRPAKWFLNRFASYLVRRKINDVNSGMRVFNKEIAVQYWNLYPDGFSLTTTITLAFIMGNHQIKNVSIDYMKRRGRSKIRPFKDTYNFILLILRLAMLFNPLRIFMPAFFFVFFMTLVSLGRDIVNLNLTETSVMLFIFSIIILMIGLLADLINKKIAEGWEK